VQIQEFFPIFASREKVKGIFGEVSTTLKILIPAQDEGKQFFGESVTANHPFQVVVSLPLDITIQ